MGGDLLLLLRLPLIGNGTRRGMRARRRRADGGLLELLLLRLCRLLGRRRGSRNIVVGVWIRNTQPAEGLRQVQVAIHHDGRAGGSAGCVPETSDGWLMSKRTAEGSSHERAPRSVVEARERSRVETVGEGPAARMER